MGSLNSDIVGNSLREYVRHFGTRGIRTDQMTPADVRTAYQASYHHVPPMRVTNPEPIDDDIDDEIEDDTDF